MSLDAMFTLELLLVAVVVVVSVAGALFISLRARRIRRQTGRRVGTADVPVGTAADEETGGGDGVNGGATPRRPPRREFYKSMGLETTEEMKIRLYSLEDYEGELGGEADALDRSGFVAALKAYRMLDDGWHDYSPRRAADVLELASEDYEIDEERSALLLRRLPPGLPTEARDVL
jgi:hypothetical protein